MLLEQMRESRKSPLVLKLKLIGVRSSRPNILVFFFEGIDDVPVYEEWISRTPTHPSYEAVPGNGKEQLLALRSLLDGDDLISRVYFFVDSDHDLDENEDDRVYILGAYSVENLLCDIDVLESFIRDEFRCAGSPDERDRIKNAFKRSYSDFSVAINELNILLFMARQERARVEARPECITDILDISLDSVSLNIQSIDGVFVSRLNVSDERKARLLADYSKLPMHRSQRGKYVLQFFRAWLRLLANDRKSEAPKLFDNSISRLSGSPENSTLRRFASQSAVPANLGDFIIRAVREPVAA